MRTPQKTKILDPTILKSQLLNAFEDGDRDLFFAIWNIKDLFKHALNYQDSLEKRKIEFYLQVHFAVYPQSPLRKNDKFDSQIELQMFKNYLESQGQELSQTSEFVTFYALPYVQNLSEHKSFRHIFTKEFNQQIKDRLNKYIESHLNKNFNSQKIESTLAVSYKDIRDMNMIMGERSKLQNTQQNVGQDYQQSDQEILKLKKVIQEMEFKLENEFEKQIRIEQLIQREPQYQLSQQIARILNPQEKGINANNNALDMYQNDFNDQQQRSQRAKTNLKDQYEDPDFQADIMSHEMSEHKRRRNNTNQLRKQEQDYEQDSQTQTKTQNIMMNFSEGKPDKQNIHSQSQVDIPSEQSDKLLNTNQKKFNNFTGLQDASKSPNQKSSNNKLISQTDKTNHLCILLKQIRETVTKACQESKKRRKEAFKYLFLINDILSFSPPPLTQNDSILDQSKLSSSSNTRQPPKNQYLLTRLRVLNSEQLNFQFMYLINVMACEPLGIQYLSQNSDLLQHSIWDVLETTNKQNQFDKLAIAIFQKFSLKKQLCIQMLKFGIGSWLLEQLDSFKIQTQQYEIQYGLALLMNLTLHKPGQICLSQPYLVIDVLEVLKKYFNSVNEQELETCVNGSIYCLMNVKKLRLKAKRDAKIDEDNETNGIENPNNLNRHMIRDQDQIIEEVTEDEFEEGQSPVGNMKSERKKKSQNQLQQNQSLSKVDDLDDQEVDEKELFRQFEEDYGEELEAEQIEEEEDDDDDNMSISYFSDDADFKDYKLTIQDPITYFENRMLQNQVFKPFHVIEKHQDSQRLNQNPSEPSNQPYFNQDSLMSVNQPPKSYQNQSDKRDQLINQEIRNALPPVYNYSKNSHHIVKNQSSSGTVIIQQTLDARNENSSSQNYASYDVNPSSHLQQNRLAQNPQNNIIQINQNMMSNNYTNDSYLNKTKSSQISIPQEMKHKDMIPRTPIDPELLAQIHQDNRDYNIVKQTKIKKANATKSGQKLQQNEYKIPEDQNLQFMNPNFQSQQQFLSPSSFPQFQQKTQNSNLSKLNHNQQHQELENNQKDSQKQTPKHQTYNTPKQQQTSQQKLQNISNNQQDDMQLNLAKEKLNKLGEEILRNEFSLDKNKQIYQEYDQNLESQLKSHRQLDQNPNSIVNQFSGGAVVSVELNNSKPGGDFMQRLMQDEQQQQHQQNHVKTTGNQPISHRFK
eukprot:403366749